MTIGLLNLSEAERRKKEEAERKAKLDEIAEKQRHREKELEEKEKQWKNEVLGRAAAVPPRAEPAAQPVEVAAGAPASAPAAAAAAAAPAPAPAATAGKYVPRHKRVAAEAPAQPPPEADRWSAGGSRADDRTPQTGGGDRWRDDRRPAASSLGAPRSSTWQSSRERGAR